MSKNFEELLKALETTGEQAETMVKAAPAAAAEGELVDEPDMEGEADQDDDAIAAAAAAEEDAPIMGKSFEVAGADGTKHQVVDATEMVKSILARQESTDTVLAKAMESMAGTLAKQNELIKSLSDQVKTVSAQGRGRKAMLSISEKPNVTDLAKSGAAADEGGMTPGEFFAKANAAFDAQKIGGKDLNTISVCIRGNHPIDEALVKKVLSA
jgi:hypothetical protein